ncbi:MAG: four-carbon acid sugar kinase family protein [Tannerella sp.]|jgi:uncharacterized protein YgbK (DUF1537 family)|nr:four-carbon acid sugar kinase family protein [Tannerella sp.]
MLAVIADDITGAAEMAGIAFRFGLSVCLEIYSDKRLPGFRNASSENNVLSDETFAGQINKTQHSSTPERLSDCDMLVLATNTRSLSENTAVEQTGKIMELLKNAGCPLIYKKTDSVLRGHIVPELQVLIEKGGYEKALLIAQNPSRGRIIRNGIYRVNETPLSETDFAHDPEFPAYTSDVKKRLGNISVIRSFKGTDGLSGANNNINNGSCINKDTGKVSHDAGTSRNNDNANDNHTNKIFVANAESRDEIRQILNDVPLKTLLAGGADLFTEYLLSTGNRERKTNPFKGFDDRKAVVVCGSTATHKLTDYEYFKRNTVAFCNMPQDVFEGASPRKWIEQIIKQYESGSSVVITINHPPQKGKDVALRLKNIMTEATNTLLQIKPPQELVIEGGATAFSILESINWYDFRVTNEIAPGIVRMSLRLNPQTYITLKPGSYPWEKTLFC